MKWIYRLSSVVILVAALSLPFYADYKNGGSMMDFKSVPEKIISAITPSSASIDGKPVDQIDELGEENAENSSIKVGYYRWQDEHGQWHFSDTKPSVNSERMVVDPNDLSTISAMDADLVARASQERNPEAAKQSDAKDMQSTELSLDNLSNVMENAQQAAQMMQERNNALSEIVGE